jgi:hypothetical protein
MNDFKTKWKVVIVKPEELETLLNDGWFLEKFQGVLTLSDIKIVAVLSKVI